MKEHVSQCYMLLVDVSFLSLCTTVKLYGSKKLSIRSCFYIFAYNEVKHRVLSAISLKAV